MTDPHEPGASRRELPAARDLDELLRRAAPGAGERAPEGFADRVRSAVELDVTLDSARHAAPPRSRLGWIAPAGLAAAAAVGAFVVGEHYGAARTTAGPDTAERPRVPEKTPLTEPAAKTLEEAMRQGAGGDASGSRSADPSAVKSNGKSNSKPDVKSDAARVARDVGRASGSIPGTLGGRFPRSSDGRFYLTFDRTAAELPKAPAVAYLLHDVPASAGLPALPGRVAQRAFLTPADAERLLSSWDAAAAAEIRPQLLGYAGLAPVVGVVTPPRVEASRPAPSPAAEEFRYADPARRAAADDVAEIVVYAKR
jgi:hypothetical protein